MIAIVSKNFVKDGRAGEFRSQARELVVHSKNEEGCLSYELCQDKENPNVLVFVERWRDEEAIELHRASSHFKNIVPKLAELVEKKEVGIYKQA